MKLTFSDGPSGETSKTPPVFSHVADFRTAGIVMNVFLLDPSTRLLSAFIWVPTSNTIGLYALLDWDLPEYVFVDTGIVCVSGYTASQRQISFATGCVCKLVLHPVRGSHRYPLRRERRRVPTLLPDLPPPSIQKTPPEENIDPLPFLQSPSTTNYLQEVQVSPALAAYRPPSSCAHGHSRERK